jgi:hypothetical protein
MRYYEGSPILPCGRVNLKTGKFQYGNIYGFWGNNTTYELYRTDEGKLRIVATAGMSPIVELGQRSSFIHDQTHRRLFEGRVIEVVSGDDGLRSLAKHQTSIAIATYK